MALRPTGLRLVRGFLSLEPWQRRMAVVCLFLLPAVGLAIRVVRMPKLQPVLNRHAVAGGQISDATALKRGKELARLVRKVAQHGVYPAKCLERALALWCLLRRERIPAEIFLGVSKTSDSFAAHAWVEYRGIVLDEGDDLIPQFERFKTPLISSSAW